MLFLFNILISNLLFEVSICQLVILNFFSNFNLHIVTGYKSPSTKQNLFKDSIIEFLPETKFNEKNSEKNIIFIGDFNIDIYDIDSPFEKMMNAIHFKRALRSKCATTNFNTQIDIIFINENSDNYISSTYE